MLRASSAAMAELLCDRDRRVREPLRDREALTGDSGEATSGIDVEELTPDVARRLDISPQTQGVVIRNLGPESAAAQAGLRRGDVILKVNKKSVDSATTFKKEMRNAGSDFVLLVNRAGRTFFETLQ